MTDTRPEGETAAAVPQVNDATYREAHPHSSLEAREIAQEGTILRGQVGSGVHGTAVGGNDDRDEMGVCLEPAEFITGLARVPNRTATNAARIPFEQWEYHTAWERPGGLRNRSGAGDLDVTIYGARKFASLAAAGNPTVLMPLFVPDAEITQITQAGKELRDGASAFASARAARRYLGYMSSQRAGILGEHNRTNRPELVAQFGYDSKYAMHALRLGVQGVEFLTTGRITLPVPAPHRDMLVQVRLGQWSLADVLARYDDLNAQLAAAAASSTLPAEPDWAWINNWLHRSYLRFWSTGQL